MSYYSVQTCVSSSLTNKNKLVTASSTASATSDKSQEDADLIATNMALKIAKDVADTQANLANIADLNEDVPNLTYYLKIEEFIKCLVEIPTQPLTDDVKSTSLYGRANIYNEENNTIGTCSASFSCSQNSFDTYSDIINYISTVDGLIVSWLTPSTLINLELDSIINGMVTECIVNCNTKIGAESIFYGKTFNLKVSSSDGKIYFYFTPYNNK
jgi:hypothetical protein